MHMKDSRLVVEVGQRFALFAVTLMALTAILSIALAVEPLVAAWAFLSVLLFASGGWFFTELGESSGLSSFAIFLLSWSLPATISPSLPIATFFPYMLGALLGGTLKRIAPQKEVGHHVKATRVFFFLLLTSGVALLGVTLPRELTVQWWFWALHLPFAASGWLFPEIASSTNTQKPDSVLDYLSGYRAILVYLSIFMLTLFLVAYVLILPLQAFTSWLVVLLLVFLLRAAFLKRAPEKPLRQS